MIRVDLSRLSAWCAAGLLVLAVNNLAAFLVWLTRTLAALRARYALLSGIVFAQIMRGLPL